MTKTINLNGLTSVKIKQSAYDMARFCWIRNRSEADIFASCVNAECTENADEVRRIPAGEYGMLDTESYETLYLNGSGAVEIVTSALLVCPFNRGGKGGGSGGMTVDTLLDITVSKGNTTNNNFRSCSPANDSIITLDGNMLDYKFVYVVASYNNEITFGAYYYNSTSGRNIPYIFDPSVFTWETYAGREIPFAIIESIAKAIYISENQIKISFLVNSTSCTGRLIILGIK